DAPAACDGDGVLSAHIRSEVTEGEMPSACRNIHRPISEVDSEKGAIINPVIRGLHLRLVGRKAPREEDRRWNVGELQQVVECPCLRAGTSRHNRRSLTHEVVAVLNVFEDPTIDATGALFGAPVARDLLRELEVRWIDDHAIAEPIGERFNQSLPTIIDGPPHRREELEWMRRIRLSFGRKAAVNPEAIDTLFATLLHCGRRQIAAHIEARLELLRKDIHRLGAVEGNLVALEDKAIPSNSALHRLGWTDAELIDRLDEITSRK